MATFRAQRMYVAPALLSVAKGAMTALNVGGTAIAAKDMISGDNNDSNKITYNPQNTALVGNLGQNQSKKFSMATIGKGALDIAKGVGKGALNFAKDNKRSLIGTTAFGTAATAGMNKLSQPSDPNKKSDSTGKILKTAAGVGGTVTAGKYIDDKMKISGLKDKLSKVGDTVNNKFAAENASKLNNKLSKVNTGKLRRAGKLGLITAGVTGAGLLAKKELTNSLEQKTYTGYGRVAKVAGRMTKNAFGSFKSGNWSQGAKQLGNAAGTIGSKVGNSALDFATFGKANEMYRGVTTSLKNQGGAAKNVGNFLDKHKTVGKLTVGGGGSYAAYEVANRAGEKIGNKIVKPIEDNN